MYDGIFNDFNIIKLHCKKNGNIKFEKTAVFELLESFHPQYGPVQSVQMIIEMLDAQSVRDIKNFSSDVALEISSDKSDDADSIIEVEVPQKVHPFIDLTENSPDVDEIVIEKSNENADVKVNNDLDSDTEGNEFRESEYHDLYDSDNSKQYDDIASLILKDSSKFDLLEGDRSNSGVVEMLEENNNDPNNNLDDGRIFDEEPLVANNTVNNNIHRMNIANDSNNLNVLREEIVSPIPGCSKEIDSHVNVLVNNTGLPRALVNRSPSPVPGCTKDFNNLDDFKRPIKVDQSILDDAICIQEIVPWASLETIHSILKKNSHSTIRKQLALWDLMSDKSNKTTINKRKSDGDIAKSSKKYLKVERNDNADVFSLDSSPTLPLHNIISNESSNDSQSSKISQHNQPISENAERSQNQYSFEEPSNIVVSNENDNSVFNNNLINSSNQLINTINNYNLIDESVDYTAVNNRVQNQNCSNRSNYDTLSIPKKDFQKLNENPENNYNLSTNNYENDNILNIKNENPDLSKVKQIKNESDEIVNINLNNKPEVLEINERCANGFANKNFSVKPSTNNQTVHFPPTTLPQNNIPLINNNSSNNIKSNVSSRMPLLLTEYKKEINTLNKGLEIYEKTFSKDNCAKKKSNHIHLIKPAKLLYERAEPSQCVINKPIINASYIRPATFCHSSGSTNQDLKIRTKDLNLANMHHARQGASNCNQRNTSQAPKVQQINSGASKKLLVPAFEIENVVKTKDLSFKIKEFNREPQLVITKNKPSVTGGTSNGMKYIIRPMSYYPNLKPKEGAKPSSTHSVSSTATSLSAAAPTTAIVQEPVIRMLQPTATITSSQNVVKATGSNAQFTALTKKANVSSNSTESLDRTLYSKLRSMFPEVKASYVKDICTFSPYSIDLNNKEYAMNLLIDHLLKEGHNHLQPAENHFEVQPVTLMSVDEQYEYLLGIFPNADPTYLRDFVEKYGNSPQVLEEFIQQKLESHDYPTKEQYLAKIKITEQQKQYTSDFNVEKFLELFPDPFKHFENATRKCHYQPIAMEFLKSHFNKNKISTLSAKYAESNYNLSLTAKALSVLGPDMKSKRISIEMPTEDIPLLQELAFIKNKSNIQIYLCTLKARDEQLFKEFQDKNLLLKCQCCLDEECMPTKCSECNVGHIFCYECIIRGTISTLSDGEAHVRCFTECDSEFSLATLQKVLPPITFSTLLKKRQTIEVMAADVDGLVSCPYCHFASIPPPEDKVFKCLNPECMKETCRQCKELNHVPLRCDEVIKADKARRIIEEKMTAALIRTCYKCKRQFYKEEGCNKMTCSCGALMCYICNKPIDNYKHFNAQGGENANLCPLWSDNRLMNAKAVISVAEHVKKTLLKDNPNLKLDTESLLPKLPPKTKGPHDDIPNANRMPEHVTRLTGAL